MILDKITALSPKLGGPLPKRGGMPCPVYPWLKSYAELRPIGHSRASAPHWDHHFLKHAINWGGRELLQCDNLNVTEHPTFLLPHLQILSDTHALVTPPGDFSGPDAFALLLGLARESEKTQQALTQTDSPTEAINLLIGPYQKEWEHFEQTQPTMNAMDILQDLSLGGTQRFVSWSTNQSSENDFGTLLSAHQGPISVICGQIHRIWDGFSPLPLLFEKELLALSGNAQDRLLGLDLLRTYHPQTQDERLNTETRNGVTCFGDVISIRCDQVNMNQVDALFIPALKKLQKQNHLLLLVPPASNSLRALLPHLPNAQNHIYLLLEGPSSLQETTRVRTVYDVRQRKKTVIAPSIQEGILVNTLPSLGFLSGELQGHFDSSGAHLIEVLKAHAENLEHVYAFFSPIGKSQSLPRASSFLVDLAAQQGE